MLNESAKPPPAVAELLQQTTQQPTTKDRLNICLGSAGAKPTRPQRPQTPMPKDQMPKTRMPETQIKDARALKLIALDKEDLSVLSAAVQDALLRVGDMVYQSKKKRFAMVVNRFCWEQDYDKPKVRTNPPHARVRAGLHFDGVLSVQSKNIVQDRSDGILELLAVDFTADPSDDVDAGIISLIFSGGGEMRLTVECIEASLADLSKRWPTPNRPEHGADK